MFAVAFEANVSQQYHFVVAPDFFKRPLQIITGVLAVAGEPFLERSNYPSRSTLPALASDGRALVTLPIYRFGAGAAGAAGGFAGRLSGEGGCA